MVEEGSVQPKSNSNHSNHEHSSLHLGNDDSRLGLTPNHTPVLSPMPSLNSLPSRMPNDRIDDDWDFLARLDQSDMNLEEDNE